MFNRASRLNIIFDFFQQFRRFFYAKLLKKITIMMCFSIKIYHIKTCFQKSKKCTMITAQKDCSIDSKFQTHKNNIH